ncbi:MAG: hypothetical protein JNJ69_12845 [Leptospiraceae bacterium]|nr:hypothetical protein [Leptospiraceae bacterium]
MKNAILLIGALTIGAIGISAKGECQQDREKFCKNAPKGDHKAMYECMKSHEAQLSEGCKEHRQLLREKSKDIQKACKKDYKKLCKGEKPGQGRIIKCLKQNESSLSADCKSALSKTNIDQ